MEKQSFGKRLIVTLCALTLMTGLLFTFTPNAISAKPEVVWNYSIWGSPRYFTAGLEVWAKEMLQKTNGRWKIKIHYGAVLSPPKQILEGLQGGLFEAGTVTPAYYPGKIPLHTVGDLPFIGPPTVAKFGMMNTGLWEHPALRKELLKWNVLPLMPQGHSANQVLGNKAIRKVEDLKGVRIRIGGEVARVLKTFGAVPTMVPAPEVFESLQRGTIDAAGFPLASHCAFGTPDVSKYAMLNISLGTFICFSGVSKKAWDALPEEFKKIHMDFSKRSPQIWEEAYKPFDEKCLATMKKKLEIVDFPASERSKLMARAEAVFEKWVKAREKQGLPGRDVLNHYLKKRKVIAGF